MTALLAALFWNPLGNPAPLAQAFGSVFSGSAPQGVRFAATPLTTGTQATWTIGFTTTQENGGLAVGKAVYLTTPTGTVLPGAAAAYTLNGVTVGAVHLSTPPNTAEVDTAAPIGPNSPVSLVAHGVVNPPAGVYPAKDFTIHTSADTAPAQPAAGLSFTPALSSLAPVAGPVGTTIVLTGGPFGTTPGSVSFTPQSGSALSVVGSAPYWSNGQVTVGVPGALGAGSVAVAVYNASDGLLSNSASFTVTPPRIALCPIGATCGSPSVPSTQNGPEVSINGGTNDALGIALEWSWGDGSTSTSAFPARHTYAQPGNYTLTATAVATDGLKDTAGMTVTVPHPTAPVLSSLFPPSGPAGTLLSLTGSGFERPGTVSGSIYFTPGGGGPPAVVAPTTETDSAATVTVPAGLPAGNVAVSVYNATTGLGSNTQTFTLMATAPVLSSLFPPSGPAGTLLSLTGSGFERPGTVSGSVYFTPGGGGPPAVVAPTTETDSAATVTVPAGLPAGNVAVSVYNTTTGLGSNTQTFTLTTPPAAGGNAPPATAPPPGVFTMDGAAAIAAITAAGSAATVTIRPTLSASGTVTVLLTAEALTDLSTAGKGVRILVAGLTLSVPVRDLRLSALQTAQGLSAVDLQGAGLAIHLQVEPEASVVANLAPQPGPLALGDADPAGMVPLSYEASAGAPAQPGVPQYAAGGPAYRLDFAVVAADGSSIAVTAVPAALTVTVPYHPAGVPDPALAAVYELGAAGTAPQRIGGWADTPTDSVAAQVSRLPANLVVLSDTETFTDISGSWAAADIRIAAAHGIVVGFPGGAFNPSAPVVRAQFAAMLSRTLALPAGNASTLPFGDVSPAAWYAPDLATLVHDGLIRGMGATVFGPTRPLTRAQLAVLAVRALSFAGQGVPSAETPPYTDAAAIPTWASPAVAAGTTAGLLRGLPDGTFDPNGTADRAQAAALLVRLLVLISPAGGGRA